MMCYMLSVHHAKQIVLLHFMLLHAQLYDMVSNRMYMHQYHCNNARAFNRTSLSICECG